MNKYLKKLPIEIYAILIPSFLMLIGYFVWALNSSKQVGLSILFEKFNYLAVMNGAELNGIFIVLWIFIALFIVIYPLFNLKKLIIKASSVTLAVKSLVIINIFASVTAYLSGLTLMYLFYFVSESRVLEFTVLMDRFERVLLGGLPAIPLINLFSGILFESITLYTYFYFVVGFMIMLIIIAFFDKKIFRQTFVAFFLSSIISIPIFTAIPIVSPDALYLTSVLKTDTVDLPPLGTFKASSHFSSLNTFFHSVWISEDGTYFSVSSFPSLHATWGLLAVLGIFKLRRKILSAFFAVWLIFNSLGTFYTLQHYALDTVAGLLFAVLMFYLAGKLMVWEVRYYTGGDWYSICDFLINCKNAVVKKLHL